MEALAKGQKEKKKKKKKNKKAKKTAPLLIQTNRLHPLSPHPISHPAHPNPPVRKNQEKKKEERKTKNNNTSIGQITRLFSGDHRIKAIFRSFRAPVQFLFFLFDDSVCPSKPAVNSTRNPIRYLFSFGSLPLLFLFPFSLLPSYWRHPGK